MALNNFNFSGHDTFSLRHGWLKKVYDRVKGQKDEYGKIFAVEEAMAEFGVGKNMVRAMRHWSMACGFLEETADGAVENTPLSDLFLSDEDGIDPYFDFPSSLWLLHWKMTTNAARCTTWNYAFTQFAKNPFLKTDLLVGIKGLIERQEWRVSLNTIERDVDCFLTTYIPPASDKSIISEDSLESPLADLRLLSRDRAHGVIHFNLGSKPSLSAGIFLYALSEYAKTKQATILSLDEMFHDAIGPGRVFKLDELSISTYLEEAEEITDGAFKWRETGPLRQLYINWDQLDVTKILKLHSVSDTATLRKAS